ncbi:hypothetical protein HDU76_009884 [Blyttiomyces sp. JEL0837]|nr:hypothetical protein HDU76_009884 [Blyttiomyces sp. JEL0837]
MERWLPPELIHLVYEHTDILTKYLNNRLTLTTTEQTTKAENDIWNEAFHQDWAGDLRLLPQHAFPTALTGLCNNVQTRSMYNRLCKHRPDLAEIVPDAIKIYLHYNNQYGYFSASDHRPILLADDDDQIDIDLSSTSLPYYRKQVYENVLSTPLIHIAMRQCWFQDLKPLINIHPKRLFLLAINMRHEDLAMKMITDWQLVVFDELPRLSDFMNGMEEIGRTGSLRFVKFIMTQKNSLPTYQGRQYFLYRRIMHGAMESGRLSVLQYIQREFGETTSFSDAFTRTIRDPQNYKCFTTKSLHCWEWSVDICIKLGVKCDALVTVKNIDEAQWVVHKLGNQPMRYEFLRHAAQQSNADTFKYLWNHRNHHVYGLPGIFRIDMATTMAIEMNSDTAKVKLIDHSPFGWLNVDTVGFYRSHQPRRKRILDMFYSAAANGNLDVVEYLYETGDIVLEDPLFTLAIQEKNLNVIKLFGCCRCVVVNINTAALRGNLEAVKFFHQHCCNETTMTKTCGNTVCRKLASQAFCSAASNGDFDMVMFFIENRREDCNFEEGLCEAIKCGSFRLVRYFYYGLGVTELKDKDVLADVENWLAVQSAKGNMARFVLEHSFVGKQAVDVKGA